jgi:BlaI family transcriptional regulator, penicillinase repressor
MNLTRAEEKIMQVLWKTGKGFIKDIIEGLNENPAPAYTTISTLVRILEQKGFVAHHAHGKSHEYYPLVSKPEYRKHSFGDLVRDYFDSNPASILSFLVQEEKLSEKDIAEIKTIIAKAGKK